MCNCLRLLALLVLTLCQSHTRRSNPRVETLNHHCQYCIQKRGLATYEEKGANSGEERDAESIPQSHIRQLIGNTGGRTDSNHIPGTKQTVMHQWSGSLKERLKA